MGNRRDVLLGLGASVGVAALSAVALRGRMRHGLEYAPGETGASLGDSGEATLRCTAGTLTPRNGEGPFYTPTTPQRRDIREPVVSGRWLVVSGRVLDSQCRPLAGAVLDFWQTDHVGRYDQHGYRYRGHQYTDAAGRFELVTIRPQAYSAMSLFRTAHLHVKVQGPATPLLTTQLYLPDATETNARDRRYDPVLALQLVGQDGGAEHARFDFVLANA